MRLCKHQNLKCAPIACPLLIDLGILMGNIKSTEVGLPIFNSGTWHHSCLWYSDGTGAGKMLLSPVALEWSIFSF